MYQVIILNTQLPICDQKKMGISNQSRNGDIKVNMTKIRRHVMIMSGIKFRVFGIYSVKKGQLVGLRRH